MNEMDKGAIYIGEYASTRVGFNVGIFPSSLSSKGLPLRTIVWLWRYPSLGVKWYSSLCVVVSNAFLPTHATVFFRTRTKELSLTMVSMICISMFLEFRTETRNLVVLLRLINSSVTPAYKKTQIRGFKNPQHPIWRKPKNWIFQYWAFNIVWQCNNLRT